MRKRRMLAGKSDPPATLPEGYPDAGFTRTQVAEAVGMKRGTYAKPKKVYDTAQDEAAPAPIRAVARRRMLAGQATGGKTAGRGRPKTDDSSRATLHESYEKTRTQVAEAVGMKRGTYAKPKKVYDTAQDEAAPAPIRAGDRPGDR